MIKKNSVLIVDDVHLGETLVMMTGSMPETIKECFLEGARGVYISSKI